MSAFGILLKSDERPKWGRKADVHFGEIELLQRVGSTRFKGWVKGLERAQSGPSSDAFSWSPLLTLPRLTSGNLILVSTRIYRRLLGNPHCCCQGFYLCRFPLLHSQQSVVFLHRQVQNSSFRINFACRLIYQFRDAAGLYGVPAILRQQWRGHRAEPISFHVVDNRPPDCGFFVRQVRRSFQWFNRLNRLG